MGNRLQVNYVYTMKDYLQLIIDQNFEEANILYLKLGQEKRHTVPVGTFSKLFLGWGARPLKVNSPPPTNAKKYTAVTVCVYYTLYIQYQYKNGSILLFRKLARPRAVPADPEVDQEV